MSANQERTLKRRIGRKLAVYTGGASLVLVAILFGVLVPIERDTVERTVLAQVGLLTESLAATFLVVDEQNRTHHADTVLRRVAQAESVEFVDVLNHEGRVVKSTDPLRVGERAPLPIALHDVSLGTDRLMVTYALPWTRSCVGCHDAQEDPVGAVRVAVSRRSVLSGLERFHVLGGLGVLMVFAFLVGLLLVITDRFVSRPIFALARLMAKAEQGDFLVRARLDREDELGVLGQSFNSMLKNITALKATEIEREADLRRAREELELAEKLEVTARELTQANSALERRVRAQELLMEAAHRLSSTLDLEALLDRLVEMTTDKLGHLDVAVFVVDTGPDGEAILRVARATGIADREEIRATRFRVGEGITGFVADTGAPAYVPDVEQERARAGPEASLLDGHGSILSVPLLHKGRVVGVMDFFHREPNRFDEDDIRLLQALGAQVAVALVNAQLFETTLELSVTDPLTGLMNRRAMETRLEMELVRAQRFNLPLTVLMLDVDHFKAYNDRMGHLLGDEALKAVATALKGSVRKVDSVARFGGEEFCVFLPRTDLAAGRDVADKLRAAIHALDVPGAKHQPLGRMSASIGVAVYPADLPPVVDGPATDALLASADRAVYEAKHAGRDCVMSAAEALKLPERPPLHATGLVRTNDEVTPPPRLGHPLSPDDVRG